MSAKNNKVDQPNESPNASQAVDKSKRSFAKMGVVAPVIMTLTSKSALGSSYACTVSGAQSGNHSGNHVTDVVCAVGFSPGAWKTPGLNSGDGNLSQWKTAVGCPFTINPSNPNTVYATFTQGGSPQWQPLGATLNGIQALGYYRQIKILWGSTTVPAVAVTGFSSTQSLHEILMSNDDLRKHAVSAYLNAQLYHNGGASAFASVYGTITGGDIINLYKLATITNYSFMSSSGTLINGNFNGGSSGSGVLSYLKSIQHNLP